MRRALLVEDSDHMVTLFTSVLENAFPGIDILVANAISDGYALLSPAINLAVIDINLPDGDGTTFVQAVCQRHPHIFTVVATMFDDDEHVFAALAAGANGYVLKEEPLDRLNRLFSGIPHGFPPISPSVMRKILRQFRQPVAVAEPPAEETDLALDALSARERDVHACLIKGYSSKETARVLNISSYTVNDHVKNIYRKLGVSSRAELVAQSH